MCQVDSDHQMLEQKRVFGAGSRDCMKCGGPAVVIARIKDAFCRSCFLVYFTHRFRATFGKAKVVRDGEKVLLAFSGGQCSSAMVNLVKMGLDQSTHKKLRFIPGLIYIDEGVVTGQSETERRKVCQQISDKMKETGFPCCTAALEESLSIPMQSQSDMDCHSIREPTADVLTTKLDEMSLKESQAGHFRDLLASASSLTARQDLVSNMRNRLLIHKALQMGYHKVAVGDSGTRLSSGVLSNLAKGRGAAVPVVLAFADNRFTDVTVVRPMREFTTKEIVMYNALCGLESVFIPSLITMRGEYATIDALTEHFVNGLQVNFPSTVSTVFRTGEKLCVAEQADESMQRCSMCMSLLDTDVSNSTALSATQLSLWLSHQASGDRPDSGSPSNCVEASSNQCCGKGDGSCHSNQKNSVSAASLNRTLCYGCRVIVRDIKDVSLLPSHVVGEAAKIYRRTKMRDEIKDFLLTEER